MIEEFATHKEIYTLKQLRHAWMMHHTDIEQAIVRNCIGSLPVTRSIAYTHCHYTTINIVVVYLYMHAVFQPLEYHKNERDNKGQRSRSRIMTGLTTQIHNRSYKSYIYTVEEITSARLAMLVGEIVHQSVRNYAKCNLLTLFAVSLH